MTRTLISFPSPYKSEKRLWKYSCASFGPLTNLISRFEKVSGRDANAFVRGAATQHRIGGMDC
jgi:hypothetical protein